MRSRFHHLRATTKCSVCVITGNNVDPLVPCLAFPSYPNEPFYLKMQFTTKIQNPKKGGKCLE